MILTLIAGKVKMAKHVREKHLFPFSAGARVCPGAGFAMIEGVLLLANVLKSYRVSTEGCDTPVPVAHLTVRAQNGIYLKFDKR